MEIRRFNSLEMVQYKGRSPVQYLLLVFGIYVFCFNGFCDEIMNSYESVFDRVGGVAVLVFYIGIDEATDKRD